MAAGTMRGTGIAGARHPNLPAYLAGGVAALFAVAFLGLMIYGVSLERSMAGDLTRLDGRLATLQEVDKQLAPLKTAASSLSQANALLKSTNAKLDQTQQTMLEMKSELGSVTSMRNDVHNMTHKVSHSFLFRGVK
jgi:uncharacterized protein YoxC